MEQKYKRFEELQKWFEEEEKKIFEELKSDIQQLTKYPIEFSGNSIRKGWKGQIAMLRTTINFVKEDGTFDFASDFEIEFDRNELIFNYGCIGNFGKESIYYIEKTFLMAKLFEKWEELETKYLGKLNNPTFSEYFNLDNELTRYEEQLEKEEKKRTFNSILESIKPGQIYYVGSDGKKDMWMEITRVTQKRVYCTTNWINFYGSTIKGSERYESHEQFVNSIQNKYYNLKED